MAYVFFGLVALGVFFVFKGLISFALFLLFILTLTGITWLADHFLWAKKRSAGSQDPIAVEYAKSFFPVILVVFVVRSFIVEPFKIPSGSMMPTLLVGDFILVNKFTYGLRVPVTNSVFFEVKHPQRGEVMVFHFPKDPSIDYIKRVVGVPGDRIEYRDKRLYINGQALDVQYDGDYSYVGAGLNQINTKRYKEQLGAHRHDILIDETNPAMDGEITVPEGHYFMMGDNRDNSNDSRFWGFVPEKNIVGRAFFVWWSFENFGRIGNSVN